MKKKLISLNIVNHNHLKMKMETDINLTFSRRQYGTIYSHGD